jgi:uncharacterized protein YggU (UPF0235/DUF167 family)
MKNLEIGSSSEGALVPAQVRPRSHRGVEVAEGRLVIRVAAAPVGGKATDEARRALAEALRVSPSRVTLVTGARSRTKLFLVSGLSAESVSARLEAFHRT